MESVAGRGNAATDASQHTYHKGKYIRELTTRGPEPYNGTDAKDGHHERSQLSLVVDEC